ncbi:MAG: PAS domain S-box protein, partial [Chloroflexi bacterium]
MNSKSDRKHLVTRLWHMLRPGRGWRTVLAIGTVAIYTAIFFPLYHVMDGGAAALSVIPVAAAGWLFGLRAGVLAGVLAFLFNTLLLNLAGQPGWDAVIRAGGVPGSAALLLIGAVVGRLHDLEAQAKRDIAERRRVEEALQKSEERLRTIVSNVPIILFAVDKAGVFTLSEGKGLEALGAKPGEVVGRSVAD